MEKEIRVRIPEEIYKKILENYNSVSEGVRDLLIKTLSGFIPLLSVSKPKIITIKHKTVCISCKRQISNGETGLWIKGLGVMCKYCILNYIKEKMTSRDYSKLILKLEVEIERLRALKNELKREISELIRKYYFLSSQVLVHEIMKKIEETIRIIEDAIYIYFTEGDKKEFTRQLKNIEDKLDRIKEEISKMQVPKSWIQKLMKELGVKIEIKPVGENSQ